MVIPSLSEVSFTLNDLPDLPRPERVLMTSPEHFDVQYVINAHMAGNVGSVDREQAQRQWDVLKSTYESCGLEVEPISGQAGLPDMVFCANQTLPFVSVDGNTKGVVLSNMFAAERAKEVQFFADHFSSKGYEIIRDLSVGETEFEGMGDALWHIGKRLLWGGYGFRTDPFSVQTHFRAVRCTHSSSEPGRSRVLPLGYLHVPSGCRYRTHIPRSI